MYIEEDFAAKSFIDRYRKVRLKRIFLSGEYTAIQWSYITLVNVYIDLVVFTCIVVDIGVNTI